MKLLLEHCCDLDMTTNHGRTALHLAVWNKRSTITLLLLKHGSNTNIQDQFGDTPLMLATLRGYLRLVKALLKIHMCDVHATGPEKDTAMHYASRHGRPDCVRLLKNHGADLEYQNMWGLTPLLVAAMHGNPRTAIELMTMGADIGQSDRTRRTVLHHAIKNNLSNLVVELLRKGANLQAQDFDGNMPLTEAIQHSDPEIVAFLIRANCDVNAKGTCIVEGHSIRQCSPVVIALHKERFDVADLLVQSGCDIQVLKSELSTGSLANKMENPKMQEWYRQTFKEPASLVVLSRKALIKHLRSIPFAEVNMMVIPPGLKDCLSYKDLLQSCKPTTHNTICHYSKMQILVRY